MNEQLEEDLLETLRSIPKPQISNLWPVTLSVWIIRTVVSMPTMIKEWNERRRLVKEWQKLEKEERERQEALYKEELGKIVFSSGSLFLPVLRLWVSVWLLLL